MKLFWFFIALTALSAVSYSLYYTGIELMVFLLVIDFMSLWYYTEISKEKKDDSFLTGKIALIERLTSDVFEKKSKRFSKKADKEGIIESLDKF